MFMQDMDFTLENLPDVQPYNLPGFHTTTFDNKLEMCRASMFVSQSIFLNFKKEGQRGGGSLFEYSERLHKAEHSFLMHKRVKKLLYASMYTSMFDMNGHSYVGDIDLE